MDDVTEGWGLVAMAHVGIEDEQERRKHTSLQGASRGRNLIRKHYIPLKRLFSAACSVFRLDTESMKSLNLVLSLGTTLKLPC